MPLDPTRFSRVSIGFVDSVRSIVDLDPADTGAVLSVTGGVAFGGGAQINTIVSGTASVDFGSVAGNDSSTATATLTGIAVGDPVLVMPGSNWSGAYFDLCLSAVASAANVVTVVAANSAATAINPDASTFRFIGFNVS